MYNSLLSSFKKTSNSKFAYKLTFNDITTSVQTGENNIELSDNTDHYKHELSENNNDYILGDTIKSEIDIDEHELPEIKQELETDSSASTPKRKKKKHKKVDGKLDDNQRSFDDGSESYKSRMHSDSQDEDKWNYQKIKKKIKKEKKAFDVNRGDINSFETETDCSSSSQKSDKKKHKSAVDETGSPPKKRKHSKHKEISIENHEEETTLELSNNEKLDCSSTSEKSGKKKHKSDVDETGGLSKNQKHSKNKDTSIENHEEEATLELNNDRKLDCSSTSQKSEKKKHKSDVDETGSPPKNRKHIKNKDTSIENHEEETTLELSNNEKLDCSSSQKSEKKKHKSDVDETGSPPKNRKHIKNKDTSIENHEEQTTLEVSNNEKLERNSLGSPKKREENQDISENNLESKLSEEIVEDSKKKKKKKKKQKEKEKEKLEINGDNEIDDRKNENTNETELEKNTLNNENSELNSDLNSETIQKKKKKKHKDKEREQHNHESNINITNNKHKDPHADESGTKTTSENESTSVIENEYNNNNEDKTNETFANKNCFDMQSTSDSEYETIRQQIYKPKPSSELFNKIKNQNFKDKINVISNELLNKSALSDTKSKSPSNRTPPQKRKKSWVARRYEGYSSSDDIEDNRFEPTVDENTKLEDVLDKIYEDEEDYELIDKEFGKLTVHLPFKVPILHTIETQVNRAILRKDREKIESYGLTYRTGHFTKQEDNKILSNWKEFCKLHDLPEDPKPFVNLKILKKITTVEDRLNFARFLAKDLNDRILYSVYFRFRRLMSKKNKRSGRFTPEEDRIIIDYLREFNDKHPYAHLAKILNRDCSLIQKRVIKLTGNVGIAEKINWDKGKLEDLVKNLLKVTKVDDVDVLKNRKISMDEWKQLGKIMKIPAIRLKNTWLVRVQRELSENNEHLYPQLRKIIIEKLYEKNVTDFHTIDWTELAKEIGSGFSGVNLYKCFYHLLYYHVPRNYYGKDRECIEFMHNVLLKQHTLGGRKLKRVSLDI